MGYANVTAITIGEAASLVACPHCLADANQACWDEQGAEKVSIHAERIENVRHALQEAADDGTFA